MEQLDCIAGRDWVFEIEDHDLSREGRHDRNELMRRTKNCADAIETEGIVRIVDASVS